MPLYEYHCLDCQETFQERRSFAQANEVAICPDCDGSQTQKSIGEFMVLSSTPALRQPAPSDQPVMSMGGCCGGHCGCHVS